MAITSDESVVVKKGPNPGDPTEITINCPDKVGLGCDIARLIFEFGLSVVKGDLSTDGRWCFLVFWVVPRVRGGSLIRWSLLKNRLAKACPSSSPVLLPTLKPPPKKKDVFLVQVCSSDRFGLLNDVTQALWEMELTIQRVNISTSPGGQAVDLFFVTDNKDELPAKFRMDAISDRVCGVVGDPDTLCEIRLAGPESGGNTFNPCQVMPVTVETFLHDTMLGYSTNLGNGSTGELDGKPRVAVDNAMSPVHSVIHIVAKDRKGMIYDCLRILKDLNYHVAYGRSTTSEDGLCLADMFVQDTRGRKIIDERLQRQLCARLAFELEQPMRVVVATKGPDSELLVCTPIEACGRGRPRVLYDVTDILRQLELQVFKGDVTRHQAKDRVWEVYRFLLLDKHGLPVMREKTQKFIASQVRNILMG